MSRLVRFPPFPPSPPPVVIVQWGRCHVHICCPSSSLISPGPLPPPKRTSSNSPAARWMSVHQWGTGGGRSLQDFAGRRGGDAGQASPSWQWKEVDEVPPFLHSRGRGEQGG